MPGGAPFHGVFRVLVGVHESPQVRGVVAAQVGLPLFSLAGGERTANRDLPKIMDLRLPVGFDNKKRTLPFDGTTL